METVKELALVAVGTLLLGLVTWALAASYIEEYDLFSTEPSNAFVAEKTAAKGLFTAPDYYVWTELPDGEGTRSLNRVSKSQIEDIEIGDTFSGYSAGSSGFSTVRDIVADSFFHLTAIFFLVLLTFGCFVGIIFYIPTINRLEKKKSPKRQAKQKRKRRKKGKRKRDGKRTGWRIAVAIGLIFLVISGRFVMNLIRKVLPFGKTETEALIIDMSEDISYTRRGESFYELIVSFRDQAGQIVQVMREVTSNTYGQYEIGDTLPIAYRNADPYDIFVRGTSLIDVVHTSSYYEFFMYLSLLTVSLFVGWAFVKKLRKGKEVQQEPEKLKGRKK
ncbi:DUF3592 domain-containing protein [Sporosarcina sp.]|uniref:DUF3592 domain-containing protein n=1 Tax=Sporosarcina sp. TaxID=49982 RepID=UPI00261F5C83|nr:DUF3592 domain-containing protein [Sporosarcina sp.]